MKTAIERNREIWQGKSDEWLFERLDNELKQKVEEINNLSNKIQAIRYINLSIHINEISGDVITIHNQYGNPFDKKFSDKNEATLHHPFQVLKQITMDEAVQLLKDDSWKPIKNPFITIKTR